MAKKKINKVPEKVGEELRKLGLTPEEAGWDCHGTYVLLHKALEKVAASKGIKFDEPKIINADISAKEVVLLVTGHMDDKSEWSFGEAAPYNSKNSYPFAMAEKRAKDRVILKLVGLHGDVYSEEEADEFQEIIAKERGSNTVEQEDKTWQEEVAESSDNKVVEIKSDKPANYDEPMQIINQQIIEQKSLNHVIDLWVQNLKDGEDKTFLNQIKANDKDTYNVIVEHRDHQVKHFLSEVKDLDSLKSLVMKDCKQPLNALKDKHPEDFKEIMAIATERKKELGGK
tara:strand:- start:123 stop:977 length:855 start_codon:yes stop_codon:yes gene_type:complete